MKINKSYLLLVATLTFIAPLKSVFATTSVPPTLIAQSFSANPEATTLDEMKKVTFSVRLRTSWPWDRQILEVKPKPTMDPLILRAKNAGAEKIELTVETPSSYPAGLAKPKVRFENNEITLSIENWDILINKEAQVSSRIKNTLDNTYSPWVNFPNAVQPLVIYRAEYNLAKILKNSNIDEILTLEKWMTRLLDEAIKPAGPEATFALRIEYSYDSIQGPDELEIQLPVLLIPSAKMTSQTAAAIATQMENWFRTNSPSKENGAFIIDLNVFITSPTENPYTPIFDTDTLSLELPNIKL